MLHNLWFTFVHIFQAVSRLAAMTCLIYGGQLLLLSWVAVKRKADVKNASLLFASVLFAIGVLAFIVR